MRQRAQGFWHDQPTPFRFHPGRGAFHRFDNTDAGAPGKRNGNMNVIIRPPRFVNREDNEGVREPGKRENQLRYSAAPLPRFNFLLGPLHYFGGYEQKGQKRRYGCVPMLPDQGPIEGMIRGGAVLEGSGSTICIPSSIASLLRVRILHRHRFGQRSAGEGKIPEPGIVRGPRADEDRRGDWLRRATSIRTVLFTFVRPWGQHFSPAIRSQSIDHFLTKVHTDRGRCSANYCTRSTW
jgi:hypothetical protein